MSAAATLIPATQAEVLAFDRFRTLELQSAAAKPVTADEMIDTLLAQRNDVEASARAAEIAYGTPYDARAVRRCTVLQKAAEFLGLVQQHRDEVKAILQGGTAPAKRARRA